jgi:TonB-linked SusC/RagA family outer membrane protein
MKPGTFGALLRSFALTMAALLALPGLSAAQQTATVTGTVTDAGTGRPIADVRIIVVGTALQAVSDLQGRYRITGLTPGRVNIRATRIGYRAAEKELNLAAGETRTSDYSMSASVVQLEEVVISGTAGQQERRAQAATVAELGVSDITKVAPIANVSQVLQSRIPGVSVLGASGTSGTSAQIRIRGAASISLSNEPLVFIDGVKAFSGLTSNFFDGQRGSKLNDIDPNDIESIEVVKGPAAATLYGADASAGVIQIITKRGKVNSGRFTQNINLEYNSIDANFTPPSNFGNCSASAVLPTSTNPLCRGQAAGTLVSDNPLVRENAFRTGQTYAVNWSGTGGGQNYGYYTSVNYETEDGTLPNNAFDRQNARVNFNWVPSNKLTLDAGFTVLSAKTVLPDNDNNVYGFLGGGLLGSPLTRNDVNPVASNNGWFGFSRDVNAITAIENEIYTHRTIANITANWNPLNGFTNRFTVGADISRDEIRRFYPKNSEGDYQGTANTGSISEERQGGENLTLDYLGNVRSDLMEGKLVSNVSFGAQLVDTRFENVFATGLGLTVNSANVVSAASTTSGGQGFSRQRGIGVLGQWQLGWQNRLFVSLGARLDANSSFGRSTEWFFLPKVGVSYVISEEPFWQNSLSFINTFRLRGAWGQTGRSPTPGASLTTLNPAPYIDGSLVASGAIPQNPGNQDLKAERGQEFEAGFDAGFLNDRLGIELTYFDKTTKDLLLVVPLPPSLGFQQNPFRNIGGVKNSGFEMALTAVPVSTQDVSWDVRVGANTLHNEVTDLGEVTPYGTRNRIEKGYQVGAWWTNRIRSIDTVSKVVTVSNDGEFMGNVLPTFEGNISTNLTLFRYFRIYGSIDTKQNFRVENLTDFFRETQLVRSDNRLDPTKLSTYERLRRYGNPTAGQPAFVRENGASATVNDVAEAYIQDGSFWRLREVSLTATLPNKWSQAFRAQSASITLGGQNLWKSTDYEGFDPEVVSSAAAATNRRDFLTIPPSRRFVVRLNLTF